jgi:hypothetical protein
VAGVVVVVVIIVEGVADAVVVAVGVITMSVRREQPTILGMSPPLRQILLTLSNTMHPIQPLPPPTLHLIAADKVVDDLDLDELIDWQPQRQPDRRRRLWGIIVLLPPSLHPTEPSKPLNQNHPPPSLEPLPVAKWIPMPTPVWLVPILMLTSTQGSIATS